MIIVLGLLNNISYGPLSGGEFCTKGVGMIAIYKKNCCYLKEGLPLCRIFQINRALCPEDVT